MDRRLGYCCINLSLASQKISTNRGMVKKTFLEKGIDYASELSLLNVKDLKKIIEWNNHNGISMFRMSSDIFPWCSEYEIADLKDFEEIQSTMKEIGNIAKQQRITLHPSPYGVLASENQEVVKKAIKEISQHAEIMDLMGFPANRFYPINVHLNSAKPDKERAAERFCNSFQLLPENAKKRLVVEIDDKKSQYTSSDLYKMIFEKISVPITFDYLHNKCNPPEGLNEKESLQLCLSTWTEGIPAITHYSDSRKIYEDATCKEVAHSDWIWETPETYGMQFDIEFEVKMKDLALLKYISEKNSLNEKRQGSPRI
jgi:UV DNA damage endonuclease